MRDETKAAPVEPNDNLLDQIRAARVGAGDPTPEALARREVAAQLRAIIHAIGNSGANADQLREVGAELAALGEVIQSPRSSLPGRGDAGDGALVPGMRDFHDRGPITGLANPLAPPASLWVDLDAEVVRGEVCFDHAFEGAPGIVHGGFVAAVLDEALGMACVFSGTPAMTAELTTRYRTHTPVLRPLSIEARLVSVDGRKVQTAGEVRDGDVVVADASGLFIAVDVAKFADLAAAKSERGRG